LLISDLRVIYGPRAVLCLPWVSAFLGYAVLPSSLTCLCILSISQEGYEGAGEIEGKKRNNLTFRCYCGRLTGKLTGRETENATPGKLSSK